MSLKSYMQLVRMHNVIGAALGAIMGFLVSSQWYLELKGILLSALVVGLIAAGGYVINDVYDVEIDKINKPYRPIPSGRISVNKAKALSITLFVIGIALSILLNIYAIVIALLTTIGLVYYAKDLKKTGFYGNLLVATTTALSIFYGGLAFFSDNWLLRIIIPTFYSFFLTLIREIVKGIEDYNGDLLNNVKTLATTLGISKSWRIAKILLTLLLVISPLPFFIGFNLIYIIILIIAFIPFTILSIIQKETIEGASKARTYLKISAIAGIIAFLLGSLPIL
ncbi:UbiA family prenyltransferase [Saccharolobus islandicus]|uniref:Digeranylgeranylglyceryl phosphate synthase n=10 Tax=Saccharolobus islandicus TaxID=43080 RepID=M9U7A6_SACIS|nr:UbiA family prenyltransferase [Sulfolobus islandicus]AGJ62874.1 (S)-2,3-di-O-geranylgeranylglyceryl phosphate synthase [Sulfolobus islandicus LAL14/1]